MLSRSDILLQAVLTNCYKTQEISGTVRVLAACYHSHLLYQYGFPQTPTSRTTGGPNKGSGLVTLAPLTIQNLVIIYIPKPVHVLAQ